jgi:small conductance mechanosensitive channel
MRKLLGVGELYMNYDVKDILDTLAESATKICLKLLIAAVILVVGLKLSKWIVNKMSKSKGFRKIETSLAHFLNSSLLITLNVLVIVTAALVLGMPATSFITILGSAGLAVGLALQGSLSNLAGSIMILFFKPYKIGDYVEFNGISGTVKDINFFYTVLITPDNKQITCPNGAVSNTNVTNYSTESTRRVDITFRAAYNCDIDTVKNVIMDAAKKDSMILAEPAPAVVLTKNDESSLYFELRVWCSNKDYWTVRSNMLESVKKAFDMNGIVIPYDQLDVHIKQ